MIRIMPVAWVSCLKPGAVTSRETTPPPTMSFFSITHTLIPAFAR